MSLDMLSPKDRGTLNEAIRRRPKRWRGLTAEAKEELVQGLIEANRVARAHLTDPEKSLDAARTIGQIVGVGVRIEAQDQTDEHHAEDLEVAKANAMSNAANAGLIPNKTYLGLDPGKV